MIQPLYLLIAAQVYFVVLGKTRLEFNITWADIVVAIVTAIAAELLFSYLERRLKGQEFKFFFPASAVAAALGLAIFFRASNPIYFAVAALLAIGSKYVVRVNGKHIFNPSNFAVVVSIFLLPWATTVELTQWGNDPAIYALITAICLFIVYRAGALLTTLSFLVSYTVLLLISIPYHLDILAVHHYGLIGPSLVIFASFMITDPRTAPSGFYPRILHGVSVSAAFFLLEIVGVRYALFVASFLTAFMGLLSAYGTAHLLRKVGWVVPKNLLACVVLLIGMSGLYVNTITRDGVFVGAAGIAPDFLLMGVESSSITQCTSDPLFVPDKRFAPAAGMTTGAAWGDFDNDGREDIFVSTIDIPSRLYRNTPDGFVDATKEANLPEFNSQSAFFADYDNDGARDLFVIYGMSGYLDAADGQPGAVKPSVQAIRVFHNEGAGQYREATKDIGLDTFMLPPGGGTLSFGDYNNDGYLDFVFAGRSTYKDITSISSGAFLKTFFEPYLYGDPTLECSPSAVKEILQRYGAAELSPAQQESFADAGGCVIVGSITLHGGTTGRGYSLDNIGVTVLYKPGSAHLFENKGGRAFVERPSFAQKLHALFASTTEQHFKPEQHPYNDISATFYQPVSFDYNKDGRVDIYLNIDFGTSLLLKNEDGFEFRNVTADAGVNYSMEGMGADVGDYDNDGNLDIVSSNIRKLPLFRNNGDGTFDNEMTQHNLNRLGTAWGVSFLDANLDGLSDLFVGNGGVEVTSNVPRIDLVRKLYLQDKLYLNAGSGFLDATSSAFCPVTNLLTRPAAVADYNNDGSPDILVGYFSYGVARTPPVLYQNQTRDKHYLILELKGTVSNADAIGAVVSVTSGSTTQTKPLLLGSSFYAQNSHRLLFGLGENGAPVDVSILWPSGLRTNLSKVEVDRSITIVER